MGTNLGSRNVMGEPKATAAFGLTRCVRTDWVSHTSLLCSLAAGSGVHQDLTVGVQHAGCKSACAIKVLNGVYTFDAPVVTATFPVNAPSCAYRHGTELCV